MKAVIFLSPSICVLNSAAEMQNFVNGRILNKPMCSSLLKQARMGIIYCHCESYNSESSISMTAVKSFV
jgi:hypothetical protein